LSLELLNGASNVEAGLVQDIASAPNGFYFATYYVFIDGPAGGYCDFNVLINGENNDAGTVDSNAGWTFIQSTRFSNPGGAVTVDLFPACSLPGAIDASFLIFVDDAVFMISE
jgi:hypothetical protein